MLAEADVKEGRQKRHSRRVRASMSLGSSRPSAVDSLLLDVEDFVVVGVAWVAGWFAILELKT